MKASFFENNQSSLVSEIINALEILMFALESTKHILWHVVIKNKKKIIFCDMFFDVKHIGHLIFNYFT